MLSLPRISARRSYASPMARKRVLCVSSKLADVGVFSLSAPFSDSSAAGTASPSCGTILFSDGAPSPSAGAGSPVCVLLSAFAASIGTAVGSVSFERDSSNRTGSAGSAGSMFSNVNKSAGG